jgi:hypothetical protein
VPDTIHVLPTRIFQRDDQRLLFFCREGRRGVTLVVSGDGDLRSYSFHDYSALEKFESEMEEFLLGTGWRPAQLSIETSAPTDSAAPPPKSARAVRRKSA